MDNLFLAVVTGDREYGRSLSLGMVSVCRSLIIRIFTAEEFLRESREFDLILWDGIEAKEAYGGRIVYMAEKPSEAVRSLAEKRFCLYKYSSASCMVASVFEIYKELTGRRAVNVKKQNVRLFAFVSCEGGTGCSTVAMAAAQEFSRFRDSKVMYLSFEELESTGQFMNCEMGIKGAEVYLYRLFNKLYPENKTDPDAEDFLPFIEGHIVRDDYGTEAFAPSRGRNPLREIACDETGRFMASIINSGRYDVIIVDMGTWLSGSCLKFLEMTEKICMVTVEGGSKLKEGKYINHIVSHCGEEVEKKLVRAENRIRKYSVYDEEEKGEEKRRNTSAENTVSISECGSFAAEGERTRIFLEGEFGNDISVLADKLTEPL